jgi:hypothetical protein
VYAVALMEVRGGFPAARFHEESNAGFEAEMSLRCLQSVGITRPSLERVWASGFDNISPDRIKRTFGSLAL